MATSEMEFSDKNWEFIKLHWQIHLFYDIEAKGATCNYNTKHNEKLHGPLKAHYKNHTNFKDVASQVIIILSLPCISDTCHPDLESRTLVHRSSNHA